MPSIIKRKAPGASNTRGLSNPSTISFWFSRPNLVYWTAPILAQVRGRGLSAWKGLTSVNAASSRPTSPTYAIWHLWDSLFRSGKLRGLTPSELNVLTSLVHHCNAETWCTWVSVETLTRNLPGSRSTIQRALRGLEAKGFIGVIHRPGQSSLVQLNPALRETEGPHDEAPTRPTMRPHRRGGGPTMGPEQSKQIPNRVEQQTEPAAPVAAPSIDLPDDLATFAESDRTIGRATVAMLTERHGVDRVRQAVEFIQAQYDKREIRVLNRGGLLRTAVEQGLQTSAQIKEQVQTEKAAAIEKNLPSLGATWGRSPNGQVVAVIAVMDGGALIRDSRGVESMRPNWAMTGWVWG